jgi:uncharacterized membrane protein (DUF2068 family)
MHQEAAKASADDPEGTGRSKGGGAPVRPERVLSLRYELIGCGLHGHQLLGTDARHIRDTDAIFVREDADGGRWYRCLRCDGWLPRAVPTEPAREFPPDRASVELPLRGRPLRDRYVLRLIAVDRGLHVAVLGALAVALFAFAAHRTLLHHDYTRILSALQGAFGGPVATRSGVASAIVSDADRLFRLSSTELYVAGGLVAAYTALLAVEMVGLWSAKRWAEYLTLIETAILVPVEIYELTKSISYLKILTLVINLAVVLYLLLAHRLFGARGGGKKERELHVRDTGWAAVERATPPQFLGTEDRGDVFSAD